MLRPRAVASIAPLAVPLAAVTLLAASCVPAWLTMATLTPDGTDTYDAAGDLTALTVTAPATNQGANLRVALIPNDEPVSKDQEACATWTWASSDQDQQGIVLRWDGLRAISVTKNVAYGIYSTVNVMAWDSTKPNVNERWQLYEQYGFMPGLMQANGQAKPLPWRMCAKSQGSAVWFKVWATTQPEPAYGDPCCSGSASVPFWANPGKAGWYAGHLAPGDSVRYENLTAGPLPAT